MFIAHFGVAMAAKKVARRPSLGTLVLAALLVDGVWPLFLLLGWEQVEIVQGITAVTPLLFVSYPWTHSLVAGLAWGALLGGGYFALRRDGNGAFWIAALVLSHWVLDALSHRPDMPLWPGGPKVGLGLWYSLPATLAVEFALLGAGRLDVCRGDPGEGPHWLDCVLGAGGHARRDLSVLGLRAAASVSAGPGAERTAGLAVHRVGLLDRAPP